MNDETRQTNEQLSDVIDRSAVLLNHAIVYGRGSGEVATKHLWSLWQGIVEVSGVSLSDACHALYEAKGPSFVCEYIDMIHPDRPWLICSGCETQTPRDGEGDCLVCGEG